MLQTCWEQRGSPRLPARCSSVRGSGPRGQGGKGDWRGLEDPKRSQTKAPPTLPVPTPSQRNHVLYSLAGRCGGGRNGRGPGKATKTISSRNVHLQLEGAQGQAPPQQASGRAAGACSEPHGHSVCRGSLGPTHLSIPSSPHSPRTFKSDQVSHQRGGAEP